VARKFAVGDVALLPAGWLQVVVAIEPARHRGHCRYGFRVAGWRLGAKRAVAFYRPRTKDRLWWVRGDKLRRPVGNVHLQRTGRPGRPRLRKRGRPVGGKR